MFLISDIIMSASQHIAGMLDRDQRTVRCYQRYRRININEPVTVTSTTLSTISTNSSTNLITVPMTSTTTTSSTSTSTTTTTSSSTCLTTTTASAFEWRTWRTSSSKATATATATKGTPGQGCCESKKRRTRKTRKSSWRITQRLRHLLVLLLSINYFPLISSAPTSKHNMSDRMNSHPKWINPCGMGQADTGTVHDVSDSVAISDKELLNQIILAARLAYTEAENFREDYVQKTFSADFQEHHNVWKTTNYDWLPSTEQIPKHLGEDAPTTHLQSLELDKSLLDTYEYLQTIAVGLEQLVWDQEDDNAPFAGKFKDIEYKLRALLCEIQVAILERGIVMRPDVRRDIMTEAYRINDNLTVKFLRDWLIFRDFMNALEYVIQVFNYLQESL